MLWHKKSTKALILKIALLAMLSALLVAACGAAPAPRGSQESMQSPAAAPAADAGSRSTTTNLYAANAPVQEVKRLVIKNANLSLVVDDPAKSLDAISSLADEMNGFVVNANLGYSRLDNGVEVPHGTITIRIPAERLDEALSRIQSESKRAPLSKTIDSQDVTKDYVDLQSRLKNLQDAEAQLREIMGSATKTEDVLNVYNQLTQVQEQIEVTKGQIQYYEQAAALSAISVDLQANEAVQSLTIGGWQPVGVAKNAIQALINTLKFMVNAGIWVVIYILPVLLTLYLIIVLPISLLLRTWRRRRSNRKPAPLAPTPPAN